MTAAKALAGALTALVVFIVSQFGLDLPGEVTSALTTLLTFAAVYFVPNKETP